MITHLDQAMGRARSGRLGLSLVMPHMQKVLTHPPKGKRRNHLTILGDDLYTSQGPKAFKRALLEKTLRSASHVMIVSGAPLPILYDGAVDAAMEFGPCVIIETQPLHEKEWLAEVQKQSRASIMVSSPTVSAG